MTDYVKKLWRRHQVSPIATCEEGFSRAIEQAIKDTQEACTAVIEREFDGQHVMHENDWENLKAATRNAYPGVKDE